jgi:hypothetical protein
MATSQTSRDRADQQHSTSEDLCPLSGLERRCLLRRIGDCHEVIQLAILGAGSAQQKAGGLAPICDALNVAEAEIARAEQLAAERCQ